METEPPRIRPAAPVPHSRDLSTFQVLREFRRNIVGAFGQRAYRERVIYARNFIQDFMMVNDPDGVRHVLLDNAQNYEKSIQLQRLTRAALGNGLVNADGASWRFQRRTMAPMFQMRHVAGFAPVMHEAAERAARRWSALPEGAELDVADEMTRATYEIISRTLFSNDVTMQYARMSEALALYLETQGRVGILKTMGLPDWVPTPSNLRARGPLSYFHGEIRALVAKRKARIEADPGGVPNDFLTMLITTRDPEGGASFGEAELFDNVMTFIFAGHETTSNALAWTFYLLGLFPDAQERVRGDEAYARMVLEEAMRLYPPAPIISRDSIGADTVCGVEIRPHTSIMISPWVLHRHRALWDEPEYFVPERFAPGRREQIPRFAYLPFGAGPRVCIGMAFAMQEATIILSTLVKRFRLELVAHHPIEPLARITLRPRHGVRMRVYKRVASASGE